MDLKEVLGWVRNPFEAIDHFTTAYGNTTYVILAAVVFCETGLVVTPFLPGDSLLFAIGAIGSRENSGLNPLVAGVILFCAALLGDNVNYNIGRAIGPRVLSSEKSRIFNKKHLEKTKSFYAKHGPKTVILARFVPIVRTFAPFVAGAGSMPYGRFLGFSVVGAALWVSSMITAGHFFGKLDWVKKHFDAVVIMIVFISILPMIVEYLRSRGKKTEVEAEPAVAAKASAKAAKPATVKAAAVEEVE